MAKLKGKTLTKYEAGRDLIGDDRDPLGLEQDGPRRATLGIQRDLVEDFDGLGHRQLGMLRACLAGLHADEQHGESENDR